MILDKIYEYEDYRAFLADYFAAMKENKSQFSFRYFASKAGFKSPNFCYYLMNGTRNVSDDSVQKLIKGLGLSGKASEYFLSMVHYTQSTSEAERIDLLDSMQQIRHSLQYKNIDPRSYRYLEEWYYPVVRELVVQYNGKSFADIAAMIVPKVSEKDVAKAVKVLLECGLISEHDGEYALCDEIVSAEEIPHFVIKHIKRQHIYNAVEVMDVLPKDKRFVAGSTLTMSYEVYEQSMAILERAHAEIVKLSVEEPGNDVYQLNFQLYPNSVSKENK